MAIQPNPQASRNVTIRLLPPITERCSYALSRDSFGIFLVSLGLWI